MAALSLTLSQHDTQSTISNPQVEAAAAEGFGTGTTKEATRQAGTHQLVAAAAETSWT